MPFERKYATEEERLAAQKASQRASYKRYKDKNKDRVRAWARALYHKHREKNIASNRAYKLRRSFGMTIDDYDAMLALQGGGCAICGDACSSGKRLAVDHCHSTGRVRGLLCSVCNRMIGHAKDNPEILEKAIIYLKRSLL